MRKSPTDSLAETERVMDGDHVVCLREEGESVWVHTDAGVQGFIGRGHLHVKRTCTVKRADGARATGLREAASHAGEDGDVRVAVSTAVANGDEVICLREGEFTWVRTGMRGCGRRGLHSARALAGEATRVVFS